MNQRVNQHQEFVTIIRSNSIAASPSLQTRSLFPKNGKEKIQIHTSKVNFSTVIKWFWNGNQDILEDACQDSPQQVITKCDPPYRKRGLNVILNKRLKRSV